jgi:hypothetical protein
MPRKLLNVVRRGKWRWPRCDTCATLFPIKIDHLVFKYHRDEFIAQMAAQGWSMKDEVYKTSVFKCAECAPKVM